MWLAVAVQRPPPPRDTTPLREAAREGGGGRCRPIGRSGGGGGGLGEGSDGRGFQPSDCCTAVALHETKENGVMKEVKEKTVS